MLIEKKWGAVFAHIDIYPDLHRVAFIALAQSCPQTDDVMWPERQAGRTHRSLPTGYSDRIATGRFHHASWVELVYCLSRFAPVDVSLPCFANLGLLHGTTTTGYPDLILIKSICRISAPVTRPMSSECLGITPTATCSSNGRASMASTSRGRKPRRERDQNDTEPRRLEAALEEGLEETFSASDAVAATQPRRQETAVPDVGVPQP